MQHITESTSSALIGSLGAVIRSNGYEYSAEKHLCSPWEHGDGGDVKNNCVENDSVGSDGVENGSIFVCMVGEDL